MSDFRPHAASAWRDGVRRVNRAPMVLAGDVRADALRRAAALVRAPRHDRGAPRRQPRCRHRWRRARATTGGRSSRRRRRVSAPRSSPRSSDSARSSTTSAPSRQPADGDDDRRRHGGVARPLVVPERRRARSLRAHAADARAGLLRRVRHALLALPPPRRSWPGSCIGRSSSSSIRGSSTTSIRGRRTT